MPRKNGFSRYHRPHKAFFALICGLGILFVVALFWLLFRVFAPAPAVQPTALPPSPSLSASTAPTESAVPSLSPPPSATPSPSPTPRVMGEVPVRVRIPALEVDAEIQDTGVEESGRMEVVASAFIISWLRDSAIPGNDGNSILAGHNRWAGQDGHLIDMDTLTVGDALEIEYADGEKRTFLLESVFIYALKTAPTAEIMDAGGPARITVITCKGPYNASWGTSENRIIATFKAEEDFIYPDPPVTPHPTLPPRA